MDFLKCYKKMISLRGLTDHTMKSYQTYISAYLTFVSDVLHKYPSQVTYAEQRRFLDRLQNERNLSDRTINVAISQIRFFTLYVLHKPWDDTQLPMRKFDMYLPYVPSQEDTKIFISSISDLKVKAMVALMYSAGLRVGEVCRLRYEDISRKTMRIHVAHGKNRSDRYAILSPCAREITYMYNKYVELTGKHDCALTGKPLELGGSLARKEATGYGLVYFAAEHLTSAGQSFDGKRVLVSGSGNVAIYAAQKAAALGATVLTMSDSDGFVLDPQGIDVELVKQIKEVKRGRICEYADARPAAKYFAGARPWDVPADIALPCATQNEIEATDAHNLAKNGITLVCEGSNLSTTDEAFGVLQDAGITYFPGKASNAGGVAVSGLEMIQNARDEHWDFEIVDAKLRDIMTSIHHNITETAHAHNLTNDYPTAATLTALKRLSQ